MVMKLGFFRAISFPLPTFSYPVRLLPNPSPLPRTLTFCLVSSTAILHSYSLSYGPSLQKGKNPFRDDATVTQIDRCRDTQRERDGNFEKSENNFGLDKDEFARVFEISAIRVPAKDCFALDNRLRGHLLNWPRIRNIARVPGDEMDGDVAELLGSETGKKEEAIDVVDSVNRRIHGKAEGDGERLSPVLYRDKLARTFNSNGYVKFRNLAKISRPNRRHKPAKSGKKDTEKIRDQNHNTAVEVVEDGGEAEEMEGLLGKDYGKRGKWRGSTRLLLLDETFSGKKLEELPEAIKVLFSEGEEEGRTSSNVELVKCRLTLFYDYWSITEILEILLPKGMIVPSAFEIIGHIACLNLSDEHLPYKRLIAKVVLDKNQPNIQTVVNKIDRVSNSYGTTPLEILAGNHSLVTMVIENGLRFHVDLATVYWSSRLGTERRRLLLGFNQDDVICDVFAGVGPIAISAAKIVKRVYANDLNPHAVEYMEKNSVVNNLEKRIQIFNMDGRRFIKSILSSKRIRKITHVIMNLPYNGVEFLDAFRGIYSERSKNEDLSFPTIHVYGFSEAPDPEFDFHERIRIALSEAAFNVDMHKVRLVAPGRWMLCASFVLPRNVAFSRSK